MKYYIPTEQEYLEAIDIWLKQNPEKTINEMSKRTKVKVNDKDISIGHKLQVVRKGESFFSDEMMQLLKKTYNFELKLKPNKIPDEIWMKAFKKWLENNPNKTLNDVKRDVKVFLDGQDYAIGNKLSVLRKGETLLNQKNMKILIEEYGFIAEKKKETISDETYFKAFDKWLSGNPDKDINDLEVDEIVNIDGKEIKIGKKLSRIRSGRSLFSEKYMQLLKEKYKFIQEKRGITEETWLEVIKAWMDLNKGYDINEISEATSFEYKGKVYNIGNKISSMRRGVNLLSNDKMQILKDNYGFSHESRVNKIDDEIYIKAIDKWLELNPGNTINDIDAKEEIEIDGEQIPIGSKLSRVRKNQTPFSPENMQLLKDKYKLVFISRQEENKRIRNEIWIKALDRWLELNPGKTINDIKKDEEIEINGELIKIGSKIQKMRIGENLLDEKNMILLKTKYLFKSREEILNSNEKIWFKAIDKWLELNPGKTINDIKPTEEIIIDNLPIKIGMRLSQMRGGKYLFDDLTMQLLEEDYEFIMENKQKIKDRLYEKNILKAINKWLELNPGKTINDIIYTEIIDVEGNQIKIGYMLSTIRSGRKTISKELEKKLKEDYKFNYEKKFNVRTDEEWLKIIDKWLLEHPLKTINDIGKIELVNFEDNIIDIGSKISHMKNGIALMKPENMKILKEKYNFKLREDLDFEGDFIRKIEPLKKEKELVIKEKSHEKYLDEYDGNVELAKEKDKKVKGIERVIREERKNKKGEITLEELKKNFNVNEEELNKYLSQIKTDTDRSEVLYIDENETLRNYCIRKGYNYIVIYNLICKSKKYDVPLKQIIREYLENGQKLPTRYVYDKNETLVKHILLAINVDSKLVIEDMKHSYTLSEAITRDVFRRNVQDKKDKWLELPYTFLIEELGPFSSKSNANIKFKNFEELLSKQEQAKLMSVYDICSKTLRTYQYLEVGLEKDVNKVKKLIKKYSLTDDEVTKASLKAMEFENGIRITENKIKSQRLRDIKVVIQNWSTLNEDSRNKLINAYKLTKEELEMINSYNEKIEYNLKLYKELIKENNVTEDEIKSIKDYHNHLFYNMNLYR